MILLMLSIARSVLVAGVDDMADGVLNEKRYGIKSLQLGKDFKKFNKPQLIINFESEQDMDGFFGWCRESSGGGSA